MPTPTHTTYPAPSAASWLDFLEPLAEPEPTLLEDALPEAAPLNLEDLRAEVEDVLAQAQADAAETMADAHVQAAALREAAWQEGLHAGRTEARVQVEAEMQAEWSAHKAALREELDTLTRQIGEAREELWRQQEPEMVALALDIARQVVKTEITQNPEVVRAVLSNALRRLTDKENVRVRVSVGDAPRVKEMRQDLLEVVDGLRHLEILDDRRVADGGCVIETNAGSIDAKIETQMAEVARALGVNEHE